MTESRDVERYVAGTLSEEEKVRFEEAMIDRPELAADVGVRRRIKAGLAQLEHNLELETLLKEQPGWPNYIRYAAAAAVVVVVAAGLMTFWNREGATPLQALLNSTEIGTKQVASSFILATTRSADVPVFEVQRTAGPVELRILVDASATAPFTAHLATSLPNGAKPIKDSSIAQISDGFAVIYLEPHELESGDYTLTLKSEAGAEQVFPFKLRVLP